MIDFIARLLKAALKLPRGRGPRHRVRAQVYKPTNANAARSIVVRFLHFQTKQQILYRGWNTKELQFEGSRITFDHDYSAALQRNRKEYGEIKRQLKERNIKFRTSYPAVLRVSLGDGKRSSARHGRRLINWSTWALLQDCRKWSSWKSCSSEDGRHRSIPVGAAHAHTGAGHWCTPKLTCDCEGEIRRASDIK